MAEVRQLHEEEEALLLAAVQGMGDLWRKLQDVRQLQGGRQLTDVAFSVVQLPPTDGSEVPVQAVSVSRGSPILVASPTQLGHAAALCYTQPAGAQAAQCMSTSGSSTGSALSAVLPGRILLVCTTFLLHCMCDCTCLKIANTVCHRHMSTSAAAATTAIDLVGTGLYLLASVTALGTNTESMPKPKTTTKIGSSGTTGWPHEAAAGHCAVSGRGRADRWAASLPSTLPCATLGC